MSEVSFNVEIWRRLSTLGHPYTPIRDKKKNKRFFSVRRIDAHLCDTVVGDSFFSVTKLREKSVEMEINQNKEKMK